MSHRILVSRRLIVGVLILQVVPLMLFPPELLTSDSQEWWLPTLLAAMVVVADVQLILRQSTQLWPWHLLSFAQGFNIISRLMMVWPHATLILNGVTTINLPYVVLTGLSMACSVVLLWYLELPDVRLGLVR